MRIIRGILFFSCFWLVPGIIHAQTIAIKDTAFGSFLCQYWPQTMNASCDSIMVLAANNQEMLDGIMDLNYRGIFNIDEAVYYNNCNIIIANNNNISNVPQLGPNVFSLDLANNKLSGFSPEFISNNTGLIKMKLSDNLLTDLPDLTSFSNLDYLDLRGNLLTFEDIEYLTSMPKFNPDSFLLGNQRKLHFTDSVQTIKIGDSFSINLNIDHNASKNVYSWYKDGVLIKQTLSNQLLINNVTATDSGNYTVIITNSMNGLASISLTYDNFVSLKIQPEVDQIIPEVTTNCEKHIIQVNQTIVDKFPAYNFKLKHENGVSLSMFNYQFETTFEGTYDLLLFNGDSLIQINDWVILKSLPDCGIDIFSPDGDGITDDYYFSYNGKIKVINKSGQQVKSLQGPVLWDGRNEYGVTLSPGLYFLEFEDGTIKSISILY